MDSAQCAEPATNQFNTTVYVSCDFNGGLGLLYVQVLIDMNSCQYFVRYIYSHWSISRE